MKNEQRHKKAQNDLAQFIANGIERIKPYSTTIMRAIMVILIAVLLFLVWQKFSAGNKADFHNDVKQLTSYQVSMLEGEQLDTLLSTYLTKYPSGDNHAQISLLCGHIYFNQGEIALTQGDREKAIAHYENAFDFYQKADAAKLKQQDLAESAVWGLAQTNEVLASLKEGNYSEEAIGLYARLLKEWPSGVYAELAQQQQSFLQRPGVAEFMTKYRESDPKLFAPSFQIPGTTEPSGDIDTTIIPGGFDSSGLFESLQNNQTETEGDAELTAPETAEPTDTAPVEATEQSPEAEELKTEESTQPSETTDDTEENSATEIPLHRYYDIPQLSWVRY